MYSFFLTYVHSITRAFLNTNTYNHWSSVPEVRAYHVVRYNRNPSAHGLEGAVPPGPVEASTLPANTLPAAGLPLGFQARLAAQPGDVPVVPTYERWHIGLLHYAVMPMLLHSFQRAMHQNGHLERVRMQFLFAYPRY